MSGLRRAIKYRRNHSQSGEGLLSNIVWYIADRSRERGRKEKGSQRIEVLVLNGD